MRSLNMIFLCGLIVTLGLLMQNCTDNVLTPVQGPDFVSVKTEDVKAKATGEVEIVWLGGNGEKSPDVEKRVFAEFNAHAAYDDKEAKGEFTYRVCSLDLLVHREIIADVSKVVIIDKTAWFMGQVVYDSKGCEGGNSHGGHSEGCSSASSGCGDDHGDEGHDSGCSGDDHDDEGHDSGCGGDDHSDSGEKGQSGPKGKSCRMNQYIFVKAYDGGTPGTNGDTIEWKWYGLNSTCLPVWDDDLSDWHLCEKTIIGGNLVVNDGTRTKHIILKK